MSPRIRFVIGGVQKGGTSALAAYLTRYTDVHLPLTKEAHVFDAPGFDEAWSASEVDARFASSWPPARDGVLVGDATPLYVFDARLIRRIARYNPAMRWILLLRNPVDRAVSQYHMERARGRERWPLLAAIAFEALRVGRHRRDLSQASPWVRHAYVARGRYDRQLDSLFAHFPSDQVLLLRSIDLRRDPAATVARARAFLGLPPDTSTMEFDPVFEGAYTREGDRLARCLLRWRFARGLRRLYRRYGVDLSQPG